MRTEGTKGEYSVYAMAKGGNQALPDEAPLAFLLQPQALRQMVVGSYVADAIIILGSLDIVLGEVDK